MIAALLDYGAGNLHSIAKALDLAGVTVHVESDPARATRADLLVLPGVGAFAAAASALAPARDRLRGAISAGLPCLGICLGMQLLFDSSEEGPGEGLGVLRGRVTRLAARRVPQIGWNTLEWNGGAPEGGAVPCGDGAHEPELEHAYFAHSYACRPGQPSLVRAWATHEGDRFPAVVRRGVVAGVQFHPEKSSGPGLRFLRALVLELTGAGMRLQEFPPCA